MKQIKPIGKFVLLKVIKQSETVGGIIVPDIADKNITTVVSVGDEVTKIKAGDEIIAWMPNAIKIDLPDVEPGLVLVKEEYIFGVLSEKSAISEN